MDINTETIFLALASGVLPALLWLFFWLREDKKRPEPRGLIFLTFIGGFVAVLFALAAEKVVEFFVPAGAVITILLWSAIEEIFKYGASFFTSLRRREMDEPIDALIYLITTALGFAALENVFFMLTPLKGGNILQSIVTGNMRFIGATVLHTLTSGVVGLFIAFSFYKEKAAKKNYLALGLILSIVLHALFNFFIINTDNYGIFTVFAVVWIATIALILFFEKVKQIKRKRNNF